MRYRFAAIITVVVVSLFCVGCSDDKSNNYSIDEGAIESVGVSITTSGRKIGVGDVESCLRLSVLLDKSSHSPTIENQEEFTKSESLARASVDIQSPFPLELNLIIFTRSVRDFPGHTYRTTINLYLEDKIIHSFKTIIGNRLQTEFEEEIVDIMPFLNAEAGSSVLLHVRAEIEFFENTDEESVTLDSPAPDNVLRATKMGNPVRVSFLP